MHRHVSAPTRCADHVGVDLYSILQVHPTAETAVIRAAYRALAMKHHPDAGGSASKMAEINEAWATLRDPLRRRRYDREQGRLQTTAAAPAASATDASRRAGSTQQAWTSPAAAPAPTAPAAGRRTFEAAAGSTDRARRDGRVLDFGRYAGWSILELSRSDPDYLLWLERTPIGRSFRGEIAEAMEVRKPAATATSMGAMRGPGAVRDRRRLGGWLR
jgi:curved DNA-binding protein CbpA